MKKELNLFFSFFIFTILLTSTTTTYAAQQSYGVKVVLVDGSDVIFPDQKPFIQDSLTYVPLRFVSLALDGIVDWNDDTKTAFVEKSGTKMSMAIGSTECFVNGIPKTIDTPAQIVNDRTMVPLRFVSETLDAKVDWDDINKIVFITPNSITVGGKVLKVNLVNGKPVYGTHSDVSNNLPTQGQYRYLGYTVKGDLFTNSAFQEPIIIDETPINERNWIKNPWDMRLCSNNPELSGETWQSILSKVPSVVADPAYLKVLAIPTAKTSGSVKAWHRGKDGIIWYQTFEIK